MACLTVELAGVCLTNPIIPASGTFGYGLEFSELYNLDMLGSISLKGITRAPRLGNSQPRIAECPSGLINSVGLQNPGVDEVVSTLLPALEKVFHKPVIANISGFCLEDYVYCAKKLSKVPNVGIIEVNISCPNVHGGGMSFGTHPYDAAAVTKAVKEVSKKPVFVKLTPNVTDIAMIAHACEDAGADGISLINTLLAMRIDIKKRRPVTAERYGGLSGPAIFPVALRMVNQVYNAVKIPVIGMGGISSASDVIEMMMAGATAVQIGAANLTDPFICPKIAGELGGLCNKLGIKNINEIIGCAARRQ